MKYNKLILSALALTLLASFSACGTATEAVNAPSNAETAAPAAEVSSDADTSSEEKDCCKDSEKDCCKDNSTADCCGNAEDVAAVASGQLEKTTFELGHLNSTAHLLAFVAKEEGFFEEQGLNVTLTQFSSAGELATGLESGKLDAAFIGSVPSLTFQSQGHDLTIFGGAMSNGHGYVIKKEFTENTDVKGVELLKGRNVASVKNSVQDAELQILLKNAHIEIGEGEDKVNVVYFDSQKDAYAALANTTIDAASVYSPYASLAASQGYEIVYRCSEEPALANQPCCRQVALTENLSGKSGKNNSGRKSLY